MVLRYDAGIDSDEEAMNEPPIDLKEYRLRLLEKKVRNRTIFGGFLLTAVAVVLFILYFTKNINLKLGSESTKPLHKLFSIQPTTFTKQLLWYR